MLNHIRCRQLGLKDYGFLDEQLSMEEKAKVEVVQEKAFPVKTLHIYFDQYDLERGHDIINPRTKPFVMLLAPDRERERNSGYPYHYAQVLRLFRMKVHLSL